MPALRSAIRMATRSSCGSGIAGSRFARSAVGSHRTHADKWAWPRLSNWPRRILDDLLVFRGAAERLLLGVGGQEALLIVNSSWRSPGSGSHSLHRAEIRQRRAGKARALQRAQRDAAALNFQTHGAVAALVQIGMRRQKRILFGFRLRRHAVDVIVAVALDMGDAQQ